MTSESPPFSAKAEAKAHGNLTVTPKKSHALLAVLTVVSFLLALIAAFFLHSDKPIPGYIFLVLAGLLFAGVFVGYFSSQKDHDQAGSVPVTLTDGPTGTTLTIDIRSLPALEKAKQLIAVIQTAFDRKPLPTPRAMLDDNMQPIPGSEEDAKRAVAATNAKAREIIETAAAAGISQDKDPTSGSSIETSTDMPGIAPPLNTPAHQYSNKAPFTAASTGGQSS